MPTTSINSAADAGKSRFRAVGLLDEAALVACAADIDLNRFARRWRIDWRLQTPLQSNVGVSSAV
ncbi:hypothetical protein [Schlesneria sp. T3-172]|uniref:hypothetical protein n=1 Tax=Schlesneria sphaerica TaxID=3373610 RepID=UPI0037C971E1